MRKSLLIAVALASLLLLPGSGAASAGWCTKLADLPLEVRLCLLDFFDYSKDLRKEHPERALAAEDIITDRRGKFAPGCIIERGRASTLLLRAKQVGIHWVVEYEYGGLASGKAVLVLSRDASGVLHQRAAALPDAKAQTAEQIEAALARTTPKT